MVFESVLGRGRARFAALASTAPKPGGSAMKCVLLRRRLLAPPIWPALTNLRCMLQGLACWVARPVLRPWGALEPKGECKQGLVVGSGWCVRGLLAGSSS